MTDPHSRKNKGTTVSCIERLSTGPLHLPKQKEIAVNHFRQPYGVPKKKTFPCHRNLVSLNIDTFGTNLIGDVFIHSLSILASKIIFT